MLDTLSHQVHRDRRIGTDEQVQALEALKQVQKTDPLSAGSQGGGAMQGALSTIKASSQKQGTQYEADARETGASD